MTAHSQALHAKPLAFTLAAFFTVIYLACLALALIVPDRELHAPWLQFFPGFAWSWQGMAIGLVESVVYGLFSGAIFAPIYNFFND
jgi:2TM family of unknown function (DUF5676)